VALAGTGGAGGVIMERRATLGWQIAFAVAFVLAWQLASGRLIPPLFVSSPMEVATKFWGLAESGKLIHHASLTALHAVGGFALGAAAGLAAGLLLGRMTRVADVLEPFFMAFYSLPKVALAPVFVLWFGIGVGMKVLFVAMIVFLLVFLNTFTGVRHVPAEQVMILKLMRASEAQITTKLILPSAVTWVFAGLRLSVPYALIGAIIGEMVASNRGLGFLLAEASGQFDTGGAFAALAAIIVMSLILNTAVRVAERLAMPWQAGAEQREMSI
jgi:NitT/TauT family transport system permease protein